MLEAMIRKGRTDITLRYNTNASNIKYKKHDILDLWKHFKKVKVGFSLDGTDTRNHYIRYPSDWATIEKNLHLLDNTPDNIEGSIATAIQILNIKHLPDFIKWKVNSKFKKINTALVPGNYQMGGGLINMHLLYIPTFLSIQILPELDKLEIVERFKQLKSWLYNNYRTDDDYWIHNPYGWKRWEAVLNHMNSEDHSDLLPGFREYIGHIDSYRKLDFKSVFPELGHLL